MNGVTECTFFSTQTAGLRYKRKRFKGEKKDYMAKAPYTTYTVPSFTRMGSVANNLRYQQHFHKPLASFLCEEDCYIVINRYLAYIMRYWGKQLTMHGNLKQLCIRILSLRQD